MPKAASNIFIINSLKFFILRSISLQGHFEKASLKVPVTEDDAKAMPIMGMLRRKTNKTA